MRTVIVEDSELVRDTLQRTLHEFALGEVIGTAPCEEEAVRLIRESDPDLVLLDLDLASGSGLGVLRRLREWGSGARVLVVSGHDAEPYRRASIAAGADGFFDKASGMPALLQRLLAWLPPVPGNEERRLRALRRLNLLDTPAEEAFDEMTRLCAALLEAPIALVSLVDSDRQWFKSSCGLEASQTARSVAFCAHAIAAPGILEVEDASRDSRFADNPLVRGPLGIRFYAGVPLTLSDGLALGTLCVIDHRPRRLTPVQRELLEVMARKVVTEMELRRRLAELEDEVRQRRDMEMRIMHLATRDPLTGLCNRAALMDRLGQALRVAERHHDALAFLFIDLNRFKLINDTLGHPVGDAMLQQVGERLTHLFRESDTVARIGGDEFAVVLPELDSPEAAHRVAEKLLQVLREPMQIDGHSLNAECSVGVAVYPGHGETAELLIRHADMALYESKRSGAHSWCLYAPEMNETAQQRVALEVELRGAIERGELELHYQPQVAIGSGALTGVEALVRWRHPQRGLVPPLDFIPLAEENGLIWDIGRFVIDEGCRQAAAWHAAGVPVPRIALNVSPVQLRPELADVIRDVLARHDCLPEWIEIEITESALTTDGPQVLELLAILRRMGIAIAVDDFGVGYSSLGQLRRLPLDVLKLDRSFIEEIAENPEDAIIVEAVMQICHGLGLRTVAEGVETEGQREQLRMMGCQSAQGYLYSRPLTPAALADWIALHHASAACASPAPYVRAPLRKLQAI